MLTIRESSLVLSPSLVTSYLCQIRDPWHSQAFTIAHIVIALSLHTSIHSFIHLRLQVSTVIQDY